MMFKDFWFVMAFYAILSCFIMPFIGYKIIGVNGLGQGYVVGSIVSLLLWFTVGRKYAKV
jgi:hypothetical protein